MPAPRKHRAPHVAVSNAERAVFLADVEERRAEDGYSDDESGNDDWGESERPLLAK